jgi:hypothetical protein
MRGLLCQLRGLMAQFALVLPLQLQLSSLQLSSQ